MNKIPFHDFDEANRAEGAKNMIKYHFYLTPITGSPFLRNEQLKIKAKENPQLNLYYHLERPPLFFITMIISTKILGEREINYRLPSFIFGILTIIIFYWLTSSISPIPTLAFVLSSDWWLSSQQALMDTMLSFFIFLSFYFLFNFLKKEKIKWLVLSGVCSGLAFLTKGQIVIIFTLLIVFLLVIKKNKLRKIIFFIIPFFITISFWLIPVIIYFNLNSFVYIFLGFAKTRALNQDLTQIAPFYWYGRWWLESFRVGLVLLSTLIISDIINKKIDQGKVYILIFLLLPFFFFSLTKNKVWWYVLPVIPVACFYVYYSLKQWPNKKINLSIILAISSLPIFYQAKSLLVIVYGFILLAISLIVFNIKISLNKKLSTLIFNLAIIASLIIFYFRFPQIQPSTPSAKLIGKFYQKIKQPKCLFLENLPYEAILFYSQAEEINYLKETTQLRTNCQNFLVTDRKIIEKDFKKIIQAEDLILYLIKKSQ